MIFDDPEKQIGQRLARLVPEYVARARKVELLQCIPAHWFSAAASECSLMYVYGQYYGCIAVSQAYIQGLAKYLAEFHGVKQSNDVDRLWRNLNKRGVASEIVVQRASEVYRDRNSFHHLNKNVETDIEILEAKALDCLGAIHEIELEFFSYQIIDSQLWPDKPQYWPQLENEPGHAYIQMRNIWL